MCSVRFMIKPDENRLTISGLSETVVTATANDIGADTASRWTRERISLKIIGTVVFNFLKTIKTIFQTLPPPSPIEKNYRTITIKLTHL